MAVTGKNFTEEEICETLFNVHRESQALWAKLVKLAKDKKDFIGFYRYREGFDQGLLALAKELKISLKQKPLPENKEEEGSHSVIDFQRAKEIKGKKVPQCPHCENFLFKLKKDEWFCPPCDKAFRIKDRSEERKT